jgi:hypothetical protein
MIINISKCTAGCEKLGTNIIVVSKNRSRVQIIETFMYLTIGRSFMFEKMNTEEGLIETKGRSSHDEDTEKK